jgi:carbamoyltransferase
MAKNLTGSKNVCTSGGSFLNCNSNELILKSELFENCYFVPPADDSGIPLGCAWWGYQQVMEITYTPTMWPYFGKTYSDVEILDATAKFDDIDVQYYSDFNEILEIIGEWLSQNRVVGWFQDGSEIGPRALGNRSILASPLKAQMKDKINKVIKKREGFRPFAPMVLQDVQDKYFETDGDVPYMNQVVRVRTEYQEKLGAVTHVDGTARIQTIFTTSNNRIYRLLRKYEKLSGYPILLNTSFNIKDKTMVLTPEDALQTFYDTEMDVLVLGNYIVYK